MLGVEKFLEILKLLAAGSSYRKIAATLGVGRGTVSKVARGLHAYQTRRVRRDYVRTESRRCPTCGALVVLSPCPVCHVRSLDRTPSPRFFSPPVLDVDLHDAEKRRYLEVRREVEIQIAAGRRRPQDGLSGSNRKDES